MLAINEAGEESGNADAFEAADLPLLQDDADAHVWADWGATWRDVHIVDADSERVDVFNLTDHDLADPDEYAQLRSMLAAAAGQDR